MESNNKPRLVNSLADLVQEVTVNLEGLTFYKISAEIGSDVEGEDPQIGDISPRYSLRLLHESNEIGVRLALRLEADIGQVDIDVAANYVTPEPVDLPRRIHLEFANEIAIMALVPFIREAVWSITQKVFGYAIVMPVMQRGEISFSSDMTLNGDSSGPD